MRVGELNGPEARTAKRLLALPANHRRDKIDPGDVDRPELGVLTHAAAGADALRHRQADTF